MKTNKKPVPERAQILNGTSLLLPSFGETVKKFPTLADLLMPRAKHGQYTRLGSALTIRANGSFWRFAISCPTEHLTTSGNLLHLDAPWAEIEHLLASGSLAWVPDYESEKKARRLLEEVIE